VRDKSRRLVMPCDGIETSIEKEPTPTWAPEHFPGAKPDWRAVHRALRAIRHSRAALDAEEMRLLREAEALQIWRPLGMVSALDYLERELGYAPRTAHPLCQGSCRLWILNSTGGQGRDALELLTKYTSKDGPPHDWSESDIASGPGKRDRHPASDVVAMVSRGG
jgi:hypothetical protein